MSEIITVACQGVGADENKRVSRNFETCYFQPINYMKWKIISMMGDEEITFDINQVGACNAHQIKFKDIKNGMIMPYTSLRNLYISNPRNTTGHFIVRLEVCDSQE